MIVCESAAHVACRGVTSSGRGLLRTKIHRAAKRAVGRISGLEKMRPARSARTRRSLRIRAGVRGVDYGTIENLHLSCRRVDCSDDPVNHNASPSRRDVSRQVISLLVSSSSICRYRAPRCPALRRRVSSFVNPFTCAALLLPDSDGRPGLSCSSPRVVGNFAGEILTQVNRPHTAMSCQSSFAWKASLTRTPPPICTSVLGSQTALIWRAVDVANKEINTPSGFPDNPWIRRRPRVFATVAVLQVPSCESKWLNRRADSGVSQTTVQYQKIFIENLHLPLCRSFFQSLSSAMCISNS